MRHGDTAAHLRRVRELQLAGSAGGALPAYNPRSLNHPAFSTTCCHCRAQSMYIRVKHKKATIFLQVEPTDTVLEVKQKLQTLISMVRAAARGVRVLVAATCRPCLQQSLACARHSNSHSLQALSMCWQCATQQQHAHALPPTRVLCLPGACRCFRLPLPLALPHHAAARAAAATQGRGGAGGRQEAGRPAHRERRRRGDVLRSSGCVCGVCFGRGGRSERRRAIGAGCGTEFAGEATPAWWQQAGVSLVASTPNTSARAPTPCGLPCVCRRWRRV